MWLHRLIIFAAVLAWAPACLDVGAGPGEAVAAPQFAAGRAPNIMLYRRPAFFLDDTAIFLTIDGRDIGKMKIQEYFEVGLARGVHRVGLRCPSREGAIRREWRLSEVKIEIGSEAQKRYIELGPCTFQERLESEALRTASGYVLTDPSQTWKDELRRWVPGLSDKSENPEVN